MATRNHQDDTAPDSLRIARFVPAPPARVFDAWTKPADLQKWWGPKGVRCLSAEFDLRVGGRYKIANELPDGTVIWIAGVFEEIDRPHRLVYTWTVTPGPDAVERVTVWFDPHADGTNLRIVARADSDIRTCASGTARVGWAASMGLSNI